MSDAPPAVIEAANELLDALEEVVVTGPAVHAADRLDAALVAAGARTTDDLIITRMAETLTGGQA